MIPLKVYGSAVYRLGSSGADGAFESVHETVVGFVVRVEAEGTTEFRFATHWLMQAIILGSSDII